MKFTITLVAIAAQFAGLAAAVPADTAATECGDRGVMQWSASDFQGKPDVDLNDIRKCKEPFAPGATHQAPGVSKVRRTDDVLLEKRDCWYGKEVGCDKGKDGGKGRCWKKCGDGPWCWTARNQGFGEWYHCSKDSDCNNGMSCGQAVGGCKECGCSC